MLVRHVDIKRFRGIKELDWHIKGRVTCLVGPGDSTKTTILDAIEMALAPKWFVPFTDSDFYQANTAEPIVIEVTVGELTSELLDDEKCGLYLRGYRSGEPPINDPEDDSEPVITVRLRVSDDLEPHWELVKEGLLEPKPLSWRDRERLAMTRLGDDVEKHLTWSRGSALARITKENGSTNPALVAANRAANTAVANMPHEVLVEASARVKEAAKGFGATLPLLKPGLDVGAYSFGNGVLSLHDDQSVPLKSAGLGTRRLVGFGIQEIGLGANAIILVDEIEHGLEPHRIRRLLRKLGDDKGVANNEDQGSFTGQVLMTSHSPTAIMALPVGSLGFVRSSKGVTTVKSVSDDSKEALQSVVRRISHAVLARKILVCEGKTEEALCRVLDEVWAKRHDGYFLACNGIVPVCGGGSEFAKSASEFRRLGYEVAVFADSDVTFTPNKETLEGDGITVVIWNDKVATEERIAADLPLKKLQEFLAIAIEERDEESVLGSISTHLGKGKALKSTEIASWTSDSICTDAEARTAIGKAAKSKQNGWFKDLNAGKRLAELVVEALPEIDDSDLAKKLETLEGWAYGE